MNKLLPCPFCWGNPVHHEKHASVVKCSSSDVCPASLGWVPAETWNTRHTPEGWQLVPVEATEEMISAYANHGGDEDYAEHDWETMLAAAPKWGDL